MGLIGEWGMPVFPNFNKALAYVDAPWGGESFPQFILVDGRYRVACALESARRANMASAAAVLMFDDYAARPFYHEVEKHLGAPELVGRAAIFQIGSQNVEKKAVDQWLTDPR